MPPPEDRPTPRDLVAASDLASAVYCPRQLYYARRTSDRSPPSAVEAVRALAFRYPTLVEADDDTLAALPVDTDPASYRTALAALADRPYWRGLIDPDHTNRLLTGRDCRGVAHKVLEPGPTERLPDPPPVPVLVSPGRPAERGVWEPQAVRATALALALAWEEGRPVPRALVEYPAVGAVRTVRLTTGRRARYRRAVRTVRNLDGPPPRLRDRTKCRACDYRAECGVKTRSLRSLFGL